MLARAARRPGGRTQRYNNAHWSGWIVGASLRSLGVAAVLATLGTPAAIAQSALPDPARDARRAEPSGGYGRSRGQDGVPKSVAAAVIAIAASPAGDAALVTHSR